MRTVVEREQHNFRIGEQPPQSGLDFAMGAGASAGELNGQKEPLTKERVAELVGERFDEEKWEAAPKDNDGCITTTTWLKLLGEAGYAVVGWPQSPAGYELKATPDEGKEGKMGDRKMSGLDLDLN